MKSAVGVLVGPFGLFACSSTPKEISKTLTLSWLELEGLLRENATRKKLSSKGLPDDYKRVGYVFSDYGMSLEFLEKSSDSNFVDTYSWAKLSSFIAAHGEVEDEDYGQAGPDGSKAKIIEVEKTNEEKIRPITIQLTPLGAILMVAEADAGLCHILPLTWKGVADLARQGKITMPLPKAWHGMEMPEKAVVNLSEEGARITLYEKAAKTTRIHGLSWGQLEGMAKEKGSTYLMENVGDVKNALMDVVGKAYPKGK